MNSFKDSGKLKKFTPIAFFLYFCVGSRLLLLLFFFFFGGMSTQGGGAQAQLSDFLGMGGSGGQRPPENFLRPYVSEHTNA